MRKSACLLLALTTSFAVCAQQPANPGSATSAAPAPQASSPAPAEAPPDHPITAAQVHELMDLTGMTNLQKQMLEGFMPGLRQMMPPYIPEDVMDDFQKSLLGADMDSLVVRVYQRHLSTEDAEQVIAFYKTPAGKRVLAIMPSVLKETQEGGAQLGEQVMQGVLERHKAEIEAAREKYERVVPGTPKN
jgi:hypothetical protein